MKIEVFMGKIDSLNALLFLLHDVLRHNLYILLRHHLTTGLPEQVMEPVQIRRGEKNRYLFKGSEDLLHL